MSPARYALLREPWFWSFLLLALGFVVLDPPISRGGEDLSFAGVKQLLGATVVWGVGCVLSFFGAIAGKRTVLCAVVGALNVLALLLLRHGALGPF